jgi:hypothetical protein
MAGTVPATVPPEVWTRTGAPTQAQPAAQIPRVAGIATFVWIGDDPQVQTPKVTLERETQPGSGAYAPVVRRSGRRVEDTEIVLAYTPSPLQRSGPQTHVWVAEWQAVPWTGITTASDDLADRGGLPLGRYRFAVEGKGWSLASQAFEVVAGGVALGTITRTGGNIRTPVTYHAPKGWRLLDMTVPSNRPVPVRSQSVTVTLRNSAGVALSSEVVTTDAMGIALVADNALAARVQITDRFGNVATATIP